MMLKGGGCENVGAQYSLPNVALEAGRDLDGREKSYSRCCCQSPRKRLLDLAC